MVHKYIYIKGVMKTLFIFSLYLYRQTEKTFIIKCFFLYAIVIKKRKEKKYDWSQRINTLYIFEKEACFEKNIFFIARH